MKILPISANYQTISFARKNKNEKSKQEYSSSDILRKQLMNLAVASMVIAGTVGNTSCITDEPDWGDMYTEQCPKVDFPVKHMDGLLPKADYMMKLLGLLPDDASLLDVRQIRTIDKQNGNIVLMEPRDESDEDKVVMDYTLIKPNGEEVYSTYEMYDNGYGYITCVLNKADGIEGSYKRYTQSSTDPNNLAEFTAINGFFQSGIIKRTNDGIKRINPDNSMDYYKVNVELK